MLTSPWGEKIASTQFKNKKKVKKNRARRAEKGCQDKKRKMSISKKIMKKYEKKKRGERKPCNG